MRKNIVFLILLISFGLFLPSFFSVNSAVKLTHDVANPSQKTCPELINGGPPKDGIPAIDKPKFISALEFKTHFSDNYLLNSMILGLVIDNTPYAYPLDILNWHEIVNHPRNESSLSVTYCPLTGSGIVFNTSFVQDSTLGTTGQLLENNLVFYDRLSDTYWSQMLTLFWCGTLKGNIPTMPVLEMPWKEWVQIFPETLLLSRKTGFRRDYDLNPYGNYGKTESILFQSAYNPRIPQHGYFHPKLLTHIIFIEGETVLFPLSELKNNNLVFFEIGNQSYVLYSKESSVRIFSTISVQKNNLIFNTDEFVKTNPAEIFADSSETIWNLNGEAISGPYLGDQLIPIFSYNAFWFSATVFFGDGYIYINDTLSKNHFEFTPFPTIADYSSPYISLLIVLTFIVLLNKKQRNSSR